MKFKIFYYKMVICIVYIQKKEIQNKKINKGKLMINIKQTIIAKFTLYLIIFIL